MKKFFFIIIILGTFVGYVLYVQHSGSSLAAIVPPSNLASLKPQATSSDISLGSPPPSNSASSDTPVQTSPASTPVSTPTPTPTPAPAPQGKYKNGIYTGSMADAYYGNVQVQVTVSGGAMTNLVFLQYPNDRSTSRFINGQAMPYLKQEALQAQSANVDIVSGATDTSQAFQQSLVYALKQAKN